MFRAIFGSNNSKTGEIPTHIQEIDVIVCRLGIILRAVLIQVYTRGGRLSEKARVLGVPRQTLKDRLERAEYEVNAILDGIVESSVQPVKNMPYRPQDAVFHRI